MWECTECDLKFGVREQFEQHKCEPKNNQLPWWKKQPDPHVVNNVIVPPQTFSRREAIAIHMLAAVIASPEMYNKPVEAALKFTDELIEALDRDVALEALDK